MIGKMSLGDGFSKRKQLQNEFSTWINRLTLAGREETNYVVSSLEHTEDKAQPGTLKKFKRVYTIKECLDKLDTILEDDKKLAMRISLTNQSAKATMINLHGEEVELTIPELIVLKNEIAPKLEEIERNIPTQATGREITSHHEADVHPNINWRVIKAIVKRERKIGQRNLQEETETIVGYNIKNVVDYGFPERRLFDRIDKIQAWQHNLKEAINQANKTLLVNI